MANSVHRRRTEPVDLLTQRPADGRFSNPHAHAVLARPRRARLWLSVASSDPPDVSASRHPYRLLVLVALTITTATLLALGRGSPDREFICLLRSSRRRSMLRAVGVSESAVEITAVRAALSRASGELCAVVVFVAERRGGRSGSEWNVGEVAAHIVSGTEAYVGYLSGAHRAFVDVTDIADGSPAPEQRRTAEAEPERGWPAWPRLGAVVGARRGDRRTGPGDEVVIWHGHPIALGDMLGGSPSTCFTAATSPPRCPGHGDLTERRPARARAALPVLPLLVDPVSTAPSTPATTSGFVATRGSPVPITDGELTVAGETHGPTATSVPIQSHCC